MTRKSSKLTERDGSTHPGSQAAANTCDAVSDPQCARRHHLVTVTQVGEPHVAVVATSSQPQGGGQEPALGCQRLGEEA